MLVTLIQVSGFCRSDNWETTWAARKILGGGILFLQFENAQAQARKNQTNGKGGVGRKLGANMLSGEVHKAVEREMYVGERGRGC